MWRIIDDNGTIFSGSEDEMRNKYSEIMHAYENDEWENVDDVDWEGDILLIEVHEINR